MFTVFAVADDILIVCVSTVNSAEFKFLIPFKEMLTSMEISLNLQQVCSADAPLLLNNINTAPKDLQKPVNVTLTST